MAYHLNHIVHDAAAYAIDVDDPAARFAFDDILGILEPKQKQYETIIRDGLPGESWRNTGVRAIETTIVTVHAVLDRQAARDAIDAYLAKQGAVCELIQHTETFGYIRIKSLKPLPLQPLAAHAGYLISDATILQQVAWTVVSVPPPPAP